MPREGKQQQAMKPEVLKVICCLLLHLKMPKKWATLLVSWKEVCNRWLIKTFFKVAEHHGLRFTYLNSKAKYKSTAIACRFKNHLASNSILQCLRSFFVCSGWKLYHGCLCAQADLAKNALKLQINTHYIAAAVQSPESLQFYQIVKYFAAWNIA